MRITCRVSARRAPPRIVIDASSPSITMQALHVLRNAAASRHAFFPTLRHQHPHHPSLWAQANTLSFLRRIHLIDDQSAMLSYTSWPSLFRKGPRV